MQPKEKDPEVLPVEKRKIRGLAKHVLVQFPALHEQWITPVKYMQYAFPPTKLPNGDYIPGSKERWFESMSFMLDDIWWLCELQYHQFWSQIIFDPGAMNSIKSFLHLAPLQQLYFKIDDPDILLMYKRIKKAVFQFMKRLLRIKESDLNYMGPEKHAEIMKKNDLVSVSLLFCLCTLYAKKELDSVREMVVHVVQYNENLKLDNCVVRTIQLFSRMKIKLKQAYRDLRSNMKHSQCVDDARLAVNAYRQTLSSSVQFLANAAISIRNFLSVYAQGCEIFLIHDFDFHIIRVYKKLIIPACLEISNLYGDDKHVQSYSKLNSMLELTRLEFVKSFHICLNTLVDNFNTRLLAQETIQRIVQLMKLGSKIENFLIDVNSVRKLNEFHELVKKKCPNDIDLTTLDNVFESIDKELNAARQEQDTKENCVEDDKIYDYIKDDYDVDDDDLTEVENDQEIGDGDLSSDDCSSEYSDWSKNENSDAEYECYLDEDSSTKEPIAAADSTPVPMSEMELQSAISQVKDLLPHLGDGFIAICLRAYRMDISALINAVLENTLPVSLKEIDFTMTEIPDAILMAVEREYDNAPSTSKSATENSGLKEFKRVEYSSYKDMFNDKSAVKQAKDIYEKYRNTEEDELYNDDVDEDYEERLFAPPVEVDAEGFYTEYTNLPVYNPNHKYAEEQEGRPQSGHKEPSEHVQNSYPEKNWRNQRSKPDEHRHRDENSARNNKNDRNAKKLAGYGSKEPNGRDEPCPNRGKEDDRYSRASSSQDVRKENRFRNERDEYPYRENVRGELHPRTSQNEGGNQRRRENDNWNVADSRNRFEGTNHRNERHDSGSSRDEFRNRERREYHRNQNFPQSRENRNEGSYRENVRNEARSWRARENHQNAPTSRDHLEENEHQNDNREEFDTNERKPLDFCENPEITRARYDHLRRVKQEKRRPSMKFYNANFDNSASSRQDDQEQDNRHYKNVHKSSNANHNRRYYSDKKRKQ